MMNSCYQFFFSLFIKVAKPVYLLGQKHKKKIKETVLLL